LFLVSDDKMSDSGFSCHGTYSVLRHPGSPEEATDQECTAGRSDLAMIFL
jgi:hypothetical protein